MTNLDLTTTFINTSGKAKSYAYVSENGCRLEAGEERTCLGGLFAIVSSSSAEMTKRYIKTLQQDLEAGNIEIKESAGIVFYDSKLDQSTVIKVEDGEARFIPAIYSDQ